LYCSSNGSEKFGGKSTFVQVLQKFYPFESGTVTINKNTQLQDLKTDDWRTIVGVVPQDISTN